MGEVTDYLRMWGQEINQIGFSYVFNAFDLNLIDQLENMSTGANPQAAAFATPLVANIKSKTDQIGDEFDFERLMAVYDAYAEAKVGKRMWDWGLQPIRIPEGAGPTPDFRVPFQGQDFFVEVKALHVRRGAVNNADIMEAGFEALVNLSKQRKRNVAIATAEMIIRPHDPASTAYDPTSAKYVAEDLLQRIDGRFREAQFQHGPTFGAVDLTMLPLFGGLAKSIYRTHPDLQTRSAVSGTLWHVAFGDEGGDLYRPIEFDGLSNLDGQFEAQGLLTARQFIKGFIFFDQSNTAFLVRKNDEAQLLPFLSRLSGTWNNDANEAICRIQDPVEIDDFRRMIRIKAVELWKARNEPLWQNLTDWQLAKEAFGIPGCAPF